MRIVLAVALLITPVAAGAQSVVAQVDQVPLAEVSAGIWSAPVERRICGLGSGVFLLVFKPFPPPERGVQGVTLVRYDEPGYKWELAFLADLQRNRRDPVPLWQVFNLSGHPHCVLVSAEAGTARIYKLQIDVTW